MTPVARISPHLDIQCPAPLRNLPYWLVWRFEGGKSGKPRKVPYYAGGGRRKGSQGSPEDRARLVTFAAAMAAARRGGFDGVGIAILEDCGFDAIDFDDVVQDPALLEQVSALLDGTYAEFSPSGNGVRGFVRHTGDLRNIKSHAREGHAFTFETFASAGFVTFTGNALPATGITGSLDDITPPSPGLLALYRERIASRGDAYAFSDTASAAALGYSIEELQGIVASLDPSTSYDRWIQIGMALHHETGGSEDGFHLWDDWSSRADNYLSSEDCLSHWASFRRASGSVITIRSVVKMAREAGATVGAPVASPDDFDTIEDTPEEAAERKAKADRFAKVQAGEILKRPRPTWVVDDVIPKAELVVVYGPSGSGKSFIMLDLAMSIARGEPWMACDVQQGPVLYICAEGAGGFRNRLEAYAHQHQVDLSSVPFWVIERTPNFLLGDDLKAVLETAKAGEGSSVIFVDTFAKVTAGANENAGEDMGKAIDNCRRLSEATGAVVVLIHHTGKDVDRGARGWSGIRAAADAEFEVGYDEATSKRWLANTKQKDGEDGGVWGFALAQVHLGVTAKGKDITSCVAVEDKIAEGRTARGRKKDAQRKLGGWEAAVLEAFSELQLGGDVTLPELILLASQKKAGHTNKAARFSAGRAVESLQKRKMLGVKEGYVFEVEE